jgi:hypothetical protein
MNMMRWLCMVFIVLLSALAHASGPALPEKYRLPTADELAAPWRSGDADTYATVLADFNGDKLVDGCFLAIENKQNKLVLLVVLVGYDRGRDKWFLLETMDLNRLQYMGVERVDPSTVMVYPPKEDDNKIPKKLKNPAIKLFASEGSSSVFCWNGQAKGFIRLWLTK